MGQPFANALRRVGAGALTGGIAGATYGLGSADPDPEMNLSDSISERLDVAQDAGISGAQFGGTVGAGATKLLEVGAKAIGGRFGGGGKGPPPIDEQGLIPPGGTPSDAKFAQQARQSILRSMERDNVQIEDLEKSLDEMIQLGHMRKELRDASVEEERLAWRIRKARKAGSLTREQEAALGNFAQATGASQPASKTEKVLHQVRDVGRTAKENAGRSLAERQLANILAGRGKRIWSHKSRKPSSRRSRHARRAR